MGGLSMKESELMIGDWVMLDNNPVKIAILAAGRDDLGLAVGGDFFARTYNMIEPIPLTEEILKDNGFYWGYTSDEEDLMGSVECYGCGLDKGWVWDEGAGSVKIIMPNGTDGGEIWLDDQCFNKTMDCVFSTMYVHELQHLLRMYDIDKDIIIRKEN